MSLVRKQLQLLRSSLRAWDASAIYDLWQYNGIQRVTIFAIYKPVIPVDRLSVSRLSFLLSVIILELMVFCIENGWIIFRPV